MQVDTTVFADRDAWRKYALGALLQVQQLATEMGMLDPLLSGPTPRWLPRPMLSIRHQQRAVLTSRQKQLARLQDENDYDTRNSSPLDQPLVAPNQRMARASCR